MDDSTDNKKVIFNLMGTLLMLVQDFEFIMRHSVRVTFAHRSDLTADKIFAEDKQTLGTLLKDLAKKASIPEETAKLLARVLADRNVFIHRLRYQKWFDLETTPGRNAVWAFLGQFSNDLTRATAILMAAQHQFAQTVGFESADFVKFRTSKFWREMVEPEKPQASQIRRRSYPSTKHGQG